MRASGAGLAMICALLAGCGGSCPSQPPPSPPPSPPPVASPPTPTTLHVLHRVLYGGAERMTCCANGESNPYPSEGQMYYVADQAGSDRTALNRYVNASGTDHADGDAAPADYALDEALAYAWIQPSLPGLTPLLEGFNPDTGDYALMLASETLPGYTPSPLPVNGYPRFGNVLEEILSISGGGVTVESNKVAGGVTWRWTWNGMEFENHNGFGSEIQGSILFWQRAKFESERGGGRILRRGANGRQWVASAAL